jgi:macrodomain Ter protein organizer (MatP/YcbG family)
MLIVIIEIGGNMEKKLVIDLNEEIIERIKKYADKRKISLSKMVEIYFENLIKENDNNSDEKFQITPLIQSLSGVIKLNNNFDYKKEYINYLTGKYK